ncbi:MULTISPECIES: restriction endonuclease subunit S [Acinetobacter]|uniref:restriction endonuclease subunit S n=1 Tax=Acinetobacter TaxID=469 RepID=UPI0004480CD4|nr:MULTISPECIES: restriction endonuclease subunit S [Acinetobacter]EXE58501.1 type I restriction modification DNA specificity domain protein [Acinetobacter sp. 1239920]MDU4031042.1 restriction endonuclease subunit S [Acinetobacter sp.]
MSIDFPKNWKQVVLEDALDALIDYRGKTPKKVDKGIPLITAKVVKSGRILPMDEFIADEDYESWMVRGIPQISDIVVTTEAPLGEVAQIKNANVALAQRIVTLRGKVDFLENDFLLFLMQSDFVQNQLEARATGSTVKGIKQSELRKIILPIPPIVEQKCIGKILSDLDDKIHLNNQINQSLESIAQAIFKSWFVDFEPVRAKIAAKQEGKDPERAAMCVISGKSEEDLKQMAEDDLAELRATASLFPDELVESELGEVPKGWFKTDLSILADLNVQSWTKKNCPEKVTYVDLSNTKWGVIQQTEEFIFEKAPSRARRVLKIGDTIVGTVRPANGSYAFIQRENLTGSTGFAVLSPKHKNYAEFIYIVATDKENIKRLAHLADGGAYPAVSYDTVLNTPCVLPIENKDGVLNLFHKNVKEFYLLSASKFEENNILASIRDTLLPKLLSGELDVSGLQGEGA